MSVDSFETVSFRVRKEDYAEFQRVANSLYGAHRLKSPKVSILAKTFLYVMTNQFKDLEAKTAAIIQQAGIPSDATILSGAQQ